MKLFILVHKKYGTKIAVIDRTYAEALARVRWEDHNVIRVETHLIDKFLTNEEVWKQPKYQVNHKVNRTK